VANEAFNKEWYRSPDVATYLQDWKFEITPSHDAFNFGSWAEGINPNGATDMMYTHLPGGHFFIAKGMDTAAHRRWKLSIGQKAITYDSTWVCNWTWTWLKTRSCLLFIIFRTKRRLWVLPNGAICFSRFIMATAKKSNRSLVFRVCRWGFDWWSYACIAGMRAYGFVMLDHVL